MTAIDEFLSQSGWTEATHSPLAGDASSRRYERVTRDATSAVLMITRAGEELNRFVFLTGWLRDNGFSAPEILAQDLSAGLLLLEDLGDDLISTLIVNQPQREAELYSQITTFLTALHQVAPPQGLTELDGAGLAALTGLVDDYYPCTSDPSQISAQIAALWAQLDDGRRVMSLRDFHAENALWLPDRSGIARMGVLDYQDAVLAHPAYDLVSAFQDARRDVNAAIEARETARYISQTGCDPTQFHAIYALLGAQRALRILAIFTRLCTDFGKPGYLQFMPRVWAYLHRNLSHRALAPLARSCTVLRAPNPSMIEELRKRCATRQMP
ncbi:hypothetical protein BFP70_14775 [Thioclava sp. SK-1]|uniref:aminoglycoside phosphotransferase family protein n=1 Tax=Thioclava sp. SK-1 TaxID=1889770 RepID=UPI00082515EA|nr:phosphotransferase [Thioclava sp. SK-1]OCX61578.1 hypothetical protein BFP70_14775 [Thioclava sp. SK-1]